MTAVRQTFEVDGIWYRWYGCIPRHLFDVLDDVTEGLSPDAVRWPVPYSISCLDCDDVDPLLCREHKGWDA